MSNPSPERIAAVEALADEMMRFCGPIFIAPKLESWPDQMIDNGTYSLIDTGKRRLLITCHHVWAKYLDEHAKNSEGVLCVALGDGEGTISFAHPERHLLAEDQELDLAIFDFEPAGLMANDVRVEHQKASFSISDWPIPPAQDGEIVVLMGFPGRHIEKIGRLCKFRGQPLPFRISGVGRDKIYIFNDGENAEVFAGNRDALGGLSGSPAYTLGRHGARLVGFVRSGTKPAAYPGDEESESLFAGTLILTPATFLRPDGRLRVRVAHRLT